MNRDQHEVCEDRSQELTDWKLSTPSRDLETPPLSRVFTCFLPPFTAAAGEACRKLSEGVMCDPRRAQARGVRPLKG